MIKAFKKSITIIISLLIILASLGCDYTKIESYAEESESVLELKEIIYSSELSSSKKLDALVRAKEEDVRALMNNKATEKKIKEIEKKYAELHDFLLKTPAVSADLAYKVDESKVDIIGIAKTLAKDNKSAQLFVTKPKEKGVLKSRIDVDEYKRIEEIELNIHLGTQLSSDLYFKAPVKITLPIPIGMNSERLLMLHEVNGEVVAFRPRDNRDNTISFYVHQIDQFYAFAEAKEDIDETIIFINDMANAYQDKAPVFRLVNPDTAEHIYTIDANEARILYVNGWGYEGICWYSPCEGLPVYRLYNSRTGLHYYASDLAEIYQVTSNNDWSVDNEGRKVFYSGGDLSVYRLLNGNHQHITADKNENEALDGMGWQQLEKEFKAVASGELNPEIAFYNKK